MIDSKYVGLFAVNIFIAQFNLTRLLKIAAGINEKNHIKIIKTPNCT